MATEANGLELKATQEWIAGFGVDFLTWNQSDVTIYCHFDSDVPADLQATIKDAVRKIEEAVNVTFDFETSPPEGSAEITFRMDQAGYFDLTTREGLTGNLHDAIAITFWSADPDAPLSGRPAANDESDPTFFDPDNYIDGKADIAFDSAWIADMQQEAFEPGGLVWQTVLHEVGHALGLRHSQDSQILNAVEQTGVYTNGRRPHPFGVRYSRSAGAG